MKPASDAGNDFEVKALDFEIKTIEGKDGYFEGYGAVFGNVDGGGDTILPGAFTKSLSDWSAKGKLPKLLWQHDTRQPIGVWTKMSEDSKGLTVSGKLTLDVQKAKEAYALMKDGAIDGLSIGYRTKDYEMDVENDIRKLKQLSLLEVSVVTMPMNDQATISSVKAAENIKTIRDFEAFLRDEGGFTVDAAKKIAAGGYKSFLSDPRDEAGGNVDPRDEAKTRSEAIARAMKELAKSIKG